MVSRHDIEEVEAIIRAVCHIDQLPLCEATSTVNNKPTPRCGKVPRMSETPKEIPVWIGRESGQRKRYLKSLEQDLASEFGPDWREKVANSSAD